MDKEPTIILILGPEYLSRSSRCQLEWRVTESHQASTRMEFLQSQHQEEMLRHPLSTRLVLVCSLSLSYLQLSIYGLSTFFNVWTLRGETYLARKKLSWHPSNVLTIRPSLPLAVIFIVYLSSYYRDKVNNETCSCINRNARPNNNQL